MQTITMINHVLTLLFLICYGYQMVYMLLPFIKKAKKEQPGRLHRYAILICARNEEAVIGQLIESIRRQDYPAELLQPATPESFGTEFLDYKMAVKTVKSFEDALGHIQENSSRHSECIVTENKERATLFTKIVDAACVYTNVSTAFTDGAQFGLGAEIGISTQKLHARGPMGLEEITSYKWVIEGDGQTRW